MTDFFSDLERQLVAATPRRADRLRAARLRRAGALSVVLLALVACGAGLATAIGGSDGGGTASGGPAGTAPTQSQTVPLSPKTSAILARQRVAVLNGTTTPGLARTIANRLQDAKVPVVIVTNGADHSRTVTCVMFTPGHEAAARRIAALLELQPDSAVPASRAERAVAGKDATVIVTVGADQHAARTP